MTDKRKEMWVKIMNPEGENRIASPAYMRTLLRIPDVSNIQNRLRILETKLVRLESPQRQGKIIEVLRGQGKHNKFWLGNRVDYRFYDLDALIEKGIIIKTRAGNQTMLELTDTEEKENDGV